MGLRDVSAILWRERHLLELWLFKLDEEQLVLAAGRTRWLPRATREVEMVLEEIRQIELERAVEVSWVALELALPAGASLRQLAESAPAPWQGMLLEHREAFLSLTDEITALRQANRELASVGSRYHQIEIMQEHSGANQLESRNQLSGVEGVDLPATMVDLQLQEVAYEAALGATARAVQPTLMDFLR
jgi:flagellar FlgN protein